MNQAKAPRKCGQCSECCTYMSVNEIEKPEDTKCAHDTAKGCAIYAERPSGCQTFVCLWIQGAFPQSARPDRIGAFVYHDPNTKLGPSLIVAETQFNALDRPAGQRLRADLKKIGQNAGLNVLNRRKPDPRATE